MMGCFYVMMLGYLELGEATKSTMGCFYVMMLGYLELGEATKSTTTFW
jgi:hypothetical protein